MEYEEFLGNKKHSTELDEYEISSSCKDMVRLCLVTYGQVIRYGFNTLISFL